MSTQSVDAATYPFNRSCGLELDDSYREAQRTPGLTRIRMPFGDAAWLVTRFDEARAVLADPRFSRAMSLDHDVPRMAEGRNFTGILTTDPPDHTRLRTLVAKAFTMRRVEALRTKVRALAERLVDEMVAAGETGDLMGAYALAIPEEVIYELLGVPLADRDRFRVWSDKVLAGNELSVEEAARTLDELRAYMLELIAQLRVAPRDDLLSGLVQARDEGDRLNEDELVDLCVAILIAGHETTANQIANFSYLLLDRPEHWEQLKADPDLIPKAVEELVRFVPLGLTALFAHYASEDIEVGGTLVREGEAVIVSHGAANRDRTQFDDADELRLDRDPKQHLGFGHGIHRCLGAPLARLQLQEALRALVTKLPDLRLAGPPEWKEHSLLRAPEVLPVRW
ncbi:cytochrome P450 [Amycolatopsis sp. MEPSY49]|uniref:cytochrome P450 n=1 Tax=Amycolatopsis sp. MEPSY49 TaxID=3151600 RepID=UPI003EFAE46B